MFQKELTEKIIGKFKTPNYGRLAILSNYRLNIFISLLFHQILFSQDQKFFNGFGVGAKKKNVQ